MANKLFSFAGLDLSSGNYRIQDTNAFSNPDREVKAIELARSDGSEAVFKRYKERHITMNGLIKGSSSDDVEAVLDNLKLYLDRVGVLDIGYRGGIRRWPNAIMENAIVSRAGSDINQMGISYSFFVPKPWALDTTSAALATATITAPSTSISVNVAGSYPALPVYTLTINTISPNNNMLNLVISNQAESRYLTISRQNPLAGDVIVIDCVKGEVRYNGIAIRATGRFPVFAPLGGTLVITHDAVALNMGLLSPYDKRFL